MAEARPENPGEHADPLLAEFLGADAGRGGPFALLGLPHEIRDDMQIATAVRRRLIQLDRHPRHLTPDADEVRLAVHAAAAQVTNLALRSALVEHWPPGAPSHMPSAWRRKMDSVSPKLARQAAMIVGASGGWNDRAKKRLAFIARSHRVSALDLVRAVRPSQGGLPGASRSVVEQVRDRIDWIREPVTAGRAWLALHATLLLMLAAVGVLIGLELSRSPEPGLPTLAGDPASNATGDASRARAIPAPRQRIAHHSAIEQELRNTGLVAAERPQDAVARATRVIESFIAGWADAPSDARDRFGGLFAELAATVTQGSSDIGAWIGVLERAIAGDDPVRAVGAGALVDLLVSDELVSVRARERLRSLAMDLDASPGRSMDARLLAQLDRQARAGSDRSPSWWAEWAGAVSACGAIAEREREEMVLRVFERLVLLKRTPDELWRSIASSLAASVSWRAGSPARLWLLDQLANPRVRADRLAGVTEVLATEVSVPGVDVTMVLDAGASQGERDTLGRAYRSAWLSLRPDPSPLQLRIAERLRETLADSEGSARFRDQIRVVEALARINAAAAMDFEGDAATAGELAEAPLAVPSRLAPTAPRQLGNDWAVRLIRAETEEAAMGVLVEARGQPMSETAAEALIDAAFRGPGRAARDRARSMIIARRTSASVLIALEREVGNRPRSSLIDTVNSVLDAAFDSGPEERALLAIRMRAALLAAAAEHAGGVPADVEYAELGLRDALARRSGLGLSVPTAVALGAIVDRWRVRAPASGPSRWNAEAATSRLAAMAAVSTGPGQIDTAYHRALVELMAGALIERAGVPPRSVERVMDRLEFEWTNARSATAQMLASQRAEALLWLALMEGSP